MIVESTAIAPEISHSTGHAGHDRTFGQSLWAVSAAFGVYFCMYMFRKPFTAANYAEPILWEMGFKTVLVTAQVGGYMVSKFVGIRVIAEMRREKRAISILWLILLAELALVAFAVVPRPWNAICLFLNGLPLGMVFGLVLGMLEGRKMTEALTAGLCASFILADGVTKTVGTMLLEAKISEAWMPAAAGALFIVPLVIGVLMLMRVRPPSEADVAARTQRVVMTKADRLSLVRKFAPGLLPLVLMYLLVTILRSIRSDYAPEIWRDLKSPALASTFASSEIYVVIGVLVINGAMVLIRGNRQAFTASLAVCGGGFVLLAAALIFRPRGIIDPFGFMVLLGLGLYLPYVAVHTTVFERMLAMTRERGNIGFLMYVADSIGYLGYVAVVVAKARNLLPMSGDFLMLLTVASWISIVASLLCVGWSAWYFLARGPKVPPVPSPAELRATARSE